MFVRRFTCLCLLLLLQGLPHPLQAQEPPKGLRDSRYQWLGVERFLRIPDDTRVNENSLQANVRRLKSVLSDRLQTEENLYLAARLYERVLHSYSKNDEARQICNQYPPKLDDHQYLASCLWLGDTPSEMKIQKIQEVSDAAHTMFPDTAIAAGVAADLAGWLNNSGRIHEAIRQYKKAFEYVPHDDERGLIVAKEDLAIVYANPLLSEKMRRLAIQHYSEIIAMGESQKPGSETNELVGHVSYNKGIAELFLFKDYENAIKDFSRALGLEAVDQDAKVFLSYSYAQLGQKEKAVEFLKQINIGLIVDPGRKSFLTCYMDLASVLLGQSQSLESCLALKEPQADVLLNLTEVLQNMKLSALDEVRMWRRFYQFFSEHLLPDLQNSVEAVSNQAELEKERADNRLNTMKLQNLSLYQYLSVALSGLALIFVVAAFLAFRSWQASRRYALTIAKERQRLQHILDSIDEGIVTIHSNLHLELEKSLHLSAIISDTPLNHLDQLLSLARISPDQTNITRECLRSCFGEASLAWEFNSANLPAEVMILGKNIALFWEPVYLDDILISVFLVLRDVTAVRQLEREREQARESADQQLVLARQILGGNSRAAMNFISQLPQQLKELNDFCLINPNYAAAFRIAHTIKGSSRSLGLKQLQECSHRIEEVLKEESAIDLPPVLADITRMNQAYATAIDSIVGQLLNKGPSNLFDIIAILRDSIEDQLSQASLSLAEIRVIEAERPASHELAKIQDILLHGLSNAADHGFVLPQKRGIKVEPAIFEVSFHKEGSRKILRMADNGAGLNHQLIRKMAEDSGWSPQAGQAWTDFLFESGVSTAQFITQSSGRGVGLNAIQAKARELGGTVQITDQDRGGTVLSVCWMNPQSLAA